MRVWLIFIDHGFSFPYWALMWMVLEHKKRFFFSPKHCVLLIDDWLLGGSQVVIIWKFLRGLERFTKHVKYFILLLLKPPFISVLWKLLQSRNIHFKHQWIRQVNICISYLVLVPRRFFGWTKSVQLICVQVQLTWTQETNLSERESVALQLSCREIEVKWMEWPVLDYIGFRPGRLSTT